MQNAEFKIEERRGGGVGNEKEKTKPENSHQTPWAAAFGNPAQG
jgi:hypothetical protein